MNNLNNFIDFSEFGEFKPFPDSDSASLVISQKKSSPSHQYIFKIFDFKCYSPNNQKIILDTFYQINLKKFQYLQCYTHLSFSFQSKLTPTFSMKYISSKTLSNVLNTPDLMSKFKIEKIIECLFAVSEGMLYLHNHLIYHGNLNPSNIVIDDAEQFYLMDFGLFPIKKLYVDDESIFNNDYKDPYMEHSEPTFKSDVYSFGVLICELFHSYFKANNKAHKKEESFHEFIQNTNKNKYEIFPPFFAKMIVSCVNEFVSERPTFKQIVETFKNANEEICGINIQQMYSRFINTNYLLNLAEKGDSFAQNKIGGMYEKGRVFERNHQKALKYYKLSADQNNSEAQNNYGVLLQENGDKNKSDLIVGARYLRKSAEQGNIHGMANYGIALLYGHGVEKNIQKAGEYLKRSADLGYSYAQVNYGFILLDNNPTIRGITEGLSYIKKAMNQNNADAYYTYGILLQNGVYVEQDDRLAMENFKIAADMGYGKAIIEYAEGNLDGVGVPKNDKIALEYYQKAFDEGNEDVRDIIDTLKEKERQDKKVQNQIIQKAKTKTKNAKSKIKETKNKHIKKQEEEEQNLLLEKSPISSSSEEFLINEDDASSAEEQTNKDETPVISHEKHPHKKTQKEQKHAPQNKEKIPKNKTPVNENNNEEAPDEKSYMKVSPKINLISLGEIVYDRPNYHNENYIYPVGYQIEKEYFSIENPNKQTIYRGTVLDGGESPIFKVECLDNTRMVFEGKNPSKPWRNVVNSIEQSKQRLGLPNRNDFSISGPCAFGFPLRNITNLIENLPNAEKCVNYKFKNYNQESHKSSCEEPKQKEIEKDNSQKSSNLSQSVDFDQSTDKLIKQGDAFLEQNNPSKAFECYEESVRRGDTNAIIKCAENAPDFEKRLVFFELAMQKNIPNALSMFRKAIMKRISQQTSKEDFISYARLFEKYEDFSDAAMLYEKGEDTLNYQICYEKAKQNIDGIEIGYQQYNFGLLCMKQHDFDVAKIMFTKAQENGILKAARKLEKLENINSKKQTNRVKSLLDEGINFYEGINGFPINVVKAMSLFEEASQLGCPKADYYIGSYYLDDKEKGPEYLKRSADAGDPDGQNKYALYLKSSKSGKENKKKMMHYFKLAADQGQSQAAFEYGREKYENGKNDEDKEEGKMYLKKSAEQTYPDALYLYSKIINETNPEESSKIYEFSISQGSELALEEQEKAYEKNENENEAKNSKRDPKKWTKSDKATIIHKLKHDGVHLTEDGNLDWRRFRTECGFDDKTDEQVSQYVEELTNEAESNEKDENEETENNQEQKQTSLSLSMIKSRFHALTRLRHAFLSHTEDELKVYLNHMKKWLKNPSWTTDHEVIFLKEISNRGFGVLKEILSMPDFTDVFKGDPSGSITKESKVIQRINKVIDFVEQNSIDELPNKNERPKQTIATNADKTSFQSAIKYNSDGTPMLPMKLQDSTMLISLGKIITDRPAFHCREYIYPAGFKSSHLYYSTLDPLKKVPYVSEIVDRGFKYPIFKVTMENHPEIAFEGTTPTGPWALLLDKTNQLRSEITKESKNSKISGPLAFGLSSPITSFLIMQMPGAKKCINYKGNNGSDNQNEHISAD